MNRILLFFVAVFAISLNNPRVTVEADERPKDERPNIVLILVDDMGYSDLGCYGGEIETPHIDRLAEDGLRFARFYNSGRCCPTRASLMTGLHPHQAGIGHMTEAPGRPTGVAGPYQGYLNDRCVTLAEVLQDAGYHTLMTGKWHLGENRPDSRPRQRGFDRFYGGLSGAFNYFRPGGERGMTEGNEPVATGADFYATDAFTDKACEYISQATATDERPFFLYLAYNAPHWPLNCKIADYEKYRGRYRTGWQPVMEARQAKQRQLGLFGPGLAPTPHVGPAWESLNDKQRDDLDAIMAAYAGCVDSIDQNVGKLRQHLEEIGEWDNTLVFLLSDNGACQERGRLGKGDDAMVRNPPLETTDGVSLGLCWANATNTPFRLYKHFLHEGGARTPMIAHWPGGIAADRRGSIVRSVGWLPDFMPTVLELSGGSQPADLPDRAGRSLVPLLQEEDRLIHDEPLFWEHEGNAAVRILDWKLVRQYGKPWELYNLQEDPTEMNDLATSDPARRIAMQALWENWATATGVSWPERSLLYQPASNPPRTGNGRQRPAEPAAAGKR